MSGDQDLIGVIRQPLIRWLQMFIGFILFGVGISDQHAPAIVVGALFLSAALSLQPINQKQHDRRPD